MYFIAVVRVPLKVRPFFTSDPLLLRVSLWCCVRPLGFVRPLGYACVLLLLRVQPCFCVWPLAFTCGPGLVCDICFSHLPLFLFRSFGFE